MDCRPEPPYWSMWHWGANARGDHSTHPLSSLIGSCFHLLTLEDNVALNSYVQVFVHGFNSFGHNPSTPYSKAKECLRPEASSWGQSGCLDGANSKGLHAQLLSEIGNAILTSHHAHAPKQVGKTPHPTSSPGWLTSLATMCHSYPLAATDSYFHL